MLELYEEKVNEWLKKHSVQDRMFLVMFMLLLFHISLANFLFYNR